MNMTPDEHYKEAERLLELVDDRFQQLDGQRGQAHQLTIDIAISQALIGAAQAHATLATAETRLR